MNKFIPNYSVPSKTFTRYRQDYHLVNDVLVPDEELTDVQEEIDRGSSTSLKAMLSRLGLSSPVVPDNVEPELAERPVVHNSASKTDALLRVADSLEDFAIANNLGDDLSYEELLAHFLYAINDNRGDKNERKNSENSGPSSEPLSSVSSEVDKVPKKEVGEQK